MAIEYAGERHPVWFQHRGIDVWWYPDDDAIRYSDGVVARLRPGVEVEPGHIVVEGTERACEACGGQSEDWYAPDACLGRLEGVRSACCGHGRMSEAYVLFDDSPGVEDCSRLRGRRAWLYFVSKREVPSPDA